MSDFYMIWQQGENLLSGQRAGVWVNDGHRFPVSFPGAPTAPVPVTLRTSARDTQTLETVSGLKFYLSGDPDDVAMVQDIWPTIGTSQNPSRPEMDGGYEISFDDGRSWIRFSKTVGYEGDPDTWIILPANQAGTQQDAGKLGPFDLVHLLVRLVIPPQVSLNKVLTLELTPDFDIQ